MDTQRLKIFCEVYRQRGFSPAAKKLGLTQSAVSQQVKTLEEELGVLLFDAVHRNMPTAAGDFLFKEGSLILATTYDIKRGIAQISGVGEGDVRFGMIDVAAIELMPGMLSKFKKEHPQIKVEAVVKTSGELMEMVERHELDFALAVTNRVPDHLEARTIYRDSIVAIVPLRSRLCKKKLLAKDLRGEPLILYPKSSHTRMLIDDVFRKAGVVPTVNMEMHYPAAICSLVQQGMGTGLISALSVEGSKLRGQAVVPIVEFRNARMIGIVSHKKRKLTPQASALMNTIIRIRAA